MDATARTRAPLPTSDSYLTLKSWFSWFSVFSAVCRCSPEGRVLFLFFIEMSSMNALIGATALNAYLVGMEIHAARTRTPGGYYYRCMLVLRGY